MKLVLSIHLLAFTLVSCCDPTTNTENVSHMIKNIDEEFDDQENR